MGWQVNLRSSPDERSIEDYSDKTSILLIYTLRQLKMTVRWLVDDSEKTISWLWDDCQSDMRWPYSWRSPQDEEFFLGLQNS